MRCCFDKAWTHCNKAIARHYKADAPKATAPKANIVRGFNGYRRLSFLPYHRKIFCVSTTAPTQHWDKYARMLSNPLGICLFLFCRAKTSKPAPLALHVGFLAAHTFSTIEYQELYAPPMEEVRDFPLLGKGPFPTSHDTRASCRGLTFVRAFCA